MEPETGIFGASDAVPEMLTPPFYRTFTMTIAVYLVPHVLA
jgi:hypothetical protein